MRGSIPMISHKPPSRLRRRKCLVSVKQQSSRDLSHLPQWLRIHHHRDHKSPIGYSTLQRMFGSANSRPLRHLWFGRLRRAPRCDQQQPNPHGTTLPLEPTLVGCMVTILLNDCRMSPRNAGLSLSRFSRFDPSPRHGPRQERRSGHPMWAPATAPTIRCEMDVAVGITVLTASLAAGTRFASTRFAPPRATCQPDPQLDHWSV